ncbi:MAG: hypothetical protein QW552_03870, partial [Ignisphaera sp.]
IFFHDNKVYKALCLYIIGYAGGTMEFEFKKLYEDEDIEVYKAPSEEELEKLVKETIASAKKPLTWRELREKFSGIAGEDRLRKILVKLIEKDEIIELPDGAFGVPGMEQNYVPRKTAKRVRPLVPSKFRARWGSMAARLRRTGLPLGEALRILEKSGIRLYSTSWGEELEEDSEVFEESFAESEDEV